MEALKGVFITGSVAQHCWNQPCIRYSVPSILTAGVSACSVQTPKRQNSDGSFQHFISESLQQAVGDEAIQLLVNVDEDDYEQGRIKLLSCHKRWWVECRKELIYTIMDHQKWVWRHVQMTKNLSKTVIRCLLYKVTQLRLKNQDYITIK